MYNEPFINNVAIFLNTPFLCENFLEMEIFENLSLKNQIAQILNFVYFELDFYCLRRHENQV